MIATAPLTQKFSFEQYLAYCDGHETPHELVEGDLIPMTVGTGKHGSIIRFLWLQFEQASAASGHPWVTLPGLVGIRSPRGRRWETSRIPDLSVLPKAQWEEMADRSAVIDFHETPPLLVVEVVSPSTKTDDYRSKRSEYALLQIPEYWIVDPLAGNVTIGLEQAQLYDLTQYQGEDLIQSPTFPRLTLTAQQILTA
ncbi:MAG: Uma2 family endonuclease [Prochlorothrix sp.]|nr:Uma2 family endonuclease [Prochlorothrix sp.]